MPGTHPVGAGGVSGVRLRRRPVPRLAAVHPPAALRSHQRTLHPGPVGGGV